MKANYLGKALLAALVFISCSKDADSPDSISVKLTALTYYRDNHDETRADKSGALNSTSYYRLINDSSASGLFVNLGAQGTQHTLSVFGIGFSFENKTTPESINGTYSFPASNATIKVILRNQAAPGRDETVMLPVYGKVTFTYDSATRKISGSIDNLEFNLLGYPPFDRNKIIINGSFKNVAAR